MHCYVQFDKNSTQNYAAKRLYLSMVQPEQEVIEAKAKLNKRKHTSKFGVRGNRCNRDKKLLNKNLESSIDT